MTENDPVVSTGVVYELATMGVMRRYETASVRSGYRW